MKQRIAIDMDGVIADLHSEWLRRYNEFYNDSLTPEDITEWNWHRRTKPSCQEKIYTYLDDPDLYLSLPVIEGSQEITYELSKQFELIIVTAAFNPNNIPAKHKWLQKHFPHINEKNYVFTRNKALVTAEWLIDDKPENLESFVGYGLLFDAPHNRNEHRFHRVNNWEVVGQWFDII